MRKVIILLVLSLCFLYVHAQKKETKFKLTGRFKGEHTTFLQLSYKNLKGKPIIDTCYIENGAFHFTGYINGPTHANLTGSTTSGSSYDPNFVMVFLEPGQIRSSLVENHFKKIRLTGSSTQKQYKKLKTIKNPVLKKEKNLHLLLGKINKKIKKDDSSVAIKNKHDSIWNKLLKYREKEKELDYTFIKTHPGSYLSPYLMMHYFSSRILSIDSAELLFNSFNEPIKESQYGKLIENKINARISSSVGHPAPLFSKKSLNGNIIDLAAFKGENYVLLDFWASWCVPCRKITPNLKEIYRKFHNKGLEIISISWDFNKKPWKKAINKDSTNKWINILGDISHGKDNSIEKRYSIPAIPELILIDKEGRIVGRYLGTKEEGTLADLVDKLATIFST